MSEDAQPPACRARAAQPRPLRFTPPYVPNRVPLAERVQLAVVAAGLLLYLCAALAMGYTYLPGKRGGVLLGGTATLSIVLGVFAFAWAALLAILDHYDRRPNEATYRRWQGLLLRSGGVLVFVAPMAWALLQAVAGGSLPEVPGLAPDYTWYSPRYREHLPAVRALLDQALWIGAVAVAGALLALLFSRLRPPRPRLTAVAGALALLGYGVLVVAYGVEDFLLGEVTVRRHEAIRAETQAGVFNAVLMARFLAGALLLVAGGVLGWMGARGRIDRPGF